MHALLSAWLVHSDSTEGKRTYGKGADHDQTDRKRRTPKDAWPGRTDPPGMRRRAERVDRRDQSDIRAGRDPP